MEEFQQPSDEVYDKDNVVEVKAANFVWDNMLDQNSHVDTDKSAKRSSSK